MELPVRDARLLVKEGIVYILVILENPPLMRLDRVIALQPHVRSDGQPTADIRLDDGTWVSMDVDEAGRGKQVKKQADPTGVRG